MTTYFRNNPARVDLVWSSFAAELCNDFNKEERAWVLWYVEGIFQLAPGVIDDRIAAVVGKTQEIENTRKSRYGDIYYLDDEMQYDLRRYEGLGDKLNVVKERIFPPNEGMPAQFAEQVCSFVIADANDPNDPGSDIFKQLLDRADTWLVTVRGIKGASQNSKVSGRIEIVGGNAEDYAKFNLAVRSARKMTVQFVRERDTLFGNTIIAITNESVGKIFKLQGINPVLLTNVLTQLIKDYTLSFIKATQRFAIRQQLPIEVIRQAFAIGLLHPPRSYRHQPPVREQEPSPQPPDMKDWKTRVELEITENSEQSLKHVKEMCHNILSWIENHNAQIKYAKTMNEVQGFQRRAFEGLALLGKAPEAPTNFHGSTTTN
jgi:hypothetical protein